MANKVGTISSYDGKFKIKRNESSDWEWYAPNKPKEKELYEGDMLYVVQPVNVKVRCDGNGQEERVPNNTKVSVTQICPKPFPSARIGEIISERIKLLSFDSDGEKSQQQTPAKLGEIYEYPIGQKFKIKRHAWADFKDYNSTWGLGLYEGDRLKVPPGVTVKVRFANNHEVQVTDNNQPWDAIDNWQSL